MTSITKPLRNLFSKRFDAWLARRMPAQLKRTLNNRSIFIFPSQLGFAYLFVMILVFLLGTNYQNNVIILLAYLLASLFITTMMASYYNFSGLSVSAKPQVKGHTHQFLSIPLVIETNKPKYGISLGFPDQPSTRVAEIKKSQDVVIQYYADKRGVYPLGRVKISSEYVLGLFTTWTWCDFGIESIVYPEAKALKERTINMSGAGIEDSQHSDNFIEGIDDFNELNTYKQGESLSRIAWKQLARGQGKYTKHYHQAQSSDVWLCLDNMPTNDLELKLSYLCYLVFQYSQKTQPYGLELTGHKIEPNQGIQHFNECLTALAVYGLGVKHDTH